jgi:hypothetical protein
MDEHHGPNVADVGSNPIWSAVSFCVKVPWMKYCPSCCKTLDHSSFSKNKAKKDGFNSTCKECKRVMQKNYYSNNKKKYQEKIYESYEKRKKLVQEFVNGLKNAPCSDCGGRFNPWQMDFDHVPDRGVKSEEVSHLVHEGHSLEFVKKEVLKCDLVCSNCHRNRTHYRLADSSIG